LSDAKVSFETLHHEPAEPGQEQRFSFNCPRFDRRCGALVIAGKTEARRPGQQRRRRAVGLGRQPRQTDVSSLGQLRRLLARLYRSRPLRLGQPKRRARDRSNAHIIRARSRAVHDAGGFPSNLGRRRVGDGPDGHRSSPKLPGRSREGTAGRFLRVAFQLALAPVRISLASGLKVWGLVTVDRPQCSDPRQHRRPAAFGRIGQHLRRRCYRRQMAFGFRDGFGEPGHRFPQCPQRGAVGQFDRIVEAARPCHQKRFAKPGASDCRAA